MLLKILLSPWVAALVLQATLVVVLLTKRMWRKFPIFLSYSVVSFAFDLALYVIFHSPFLRRAYVGTYWVSEGVGLILGLAVVYEIFKHLFSPYPALGRLARQCLYASIALLAILGFTVAYAQPLGQIYRGQSALFAVEQATRILEVGLLFSLLLFASAFGLHWRQYIFGMALGLGVFAAVELVAVTMRLQFGVVVNPIFNIIRSISFNSSLLIWISYILAPELATRPVELPKRAQLEQWNRAVMELIYQ